MGYIRSEQGGVRWHQWGPYVYIHDLRVFKKYRGKGWGRVLLEKAIEMIRKEHPGLQICVLPRPMDESTDFNRLCEFYKKYKLKILT